MSSIIMYQRVTMRGDLKGLVRLCVLMLVYLCWVLHRFWASRRGVKKAAARTLLSLASACPAKNNRKNDTLPRAHRCLHITSAQVHFKPS